MNRTMRAVLCYTRTDLRWLLVTAAVIGLFGEVLGALTCLLGEPENAGKIALGIMLGMTILCSTVMSILYLNTQFSLFLSFSATRRGLTAGLLLHSLRMNLMLVGFAFVWGTVDTLVRGIFTGGYPLPWQWIPWFVWPIALVAPVWVGLFLGGVLQRFGAVGFWICYAVFIIACGNISHWADAALRLFAPVPWPMLAASILAVVAVLAALSLHWLQRTAIK